MMTGDHPSRAARLAGTVFVTVLIAALIGFVFGKFTIDILLVMVGGGAAIYVIYGWMADAADHQKSGW